MKPSFFFWLLVGLLAMFDVEARPQAGSKAERATQVGTMDTIRMHETYREGDFDVLIAMAEAALKSATRATASESLFIHKHLAVVYAKYPEKVELAKYHMIRMLNMDPHANLFDMDASDAVYALFDRVRAENDVRMSRRAGANPHSTYVSVGPNGMSSNPVSGDPHRVWQSEGDVRRQGSRNADSKAWMYWVGGITVLGVGAGVTAYLWPEPKPSTEMNLIDNRTESKP